MSQHYRRAIRLAAVLGCPLAVPRPVAAQSAPASDRWLPRVSIGVHAARSVFQAPYRGDYQTDLAPMVAVTAYQPIGSGFAGSLGIQYVTERLTGLGPVLRYRFGYLAIPVMLDRRVARIGPVATDIHAGGVVGIPLGCNVASQVPGGTESEIGCGDPPVSVDDQRVDWSLRAGASARIPAGSTWLGLTGALQYGLRDVFGRARITTWFLGFEVGR